MADRIAAVRAYIVPPEAPDSLMDKATGRPSWIRGQVASPLANYPEFASDRSAGAASALLGKVIVEVESDSGVVGHAHTSGGFAAAAVIEGHLARLITGEQVSAHERTWDRMHRGSLAYGRKGLAINAISAVDLALWDLHGRLRKEPVHELIGGRIWDSIRLYATGPSPRTAERLGFAGAKMALPYAPAAGSEGFARNLEMIQNARDSVAVDFPLMIDCWMSLDVPYAARLMDAMAPLGFVWIEEPLPPDDYAGLTELRRRADPRVLIATGEHEYTLAGYRQLIETGACGILQPDLSWCGGLTELLKISALARAHNVPVVPHCSGVYAYHFAVTRPEPRLAEFLIGIDPTGEPADDEDLLRRALQRSEPYFTQAPLPRNGELALTDEPGFGIELIRELPLLRPFHGETWHY